MIISLIRQGLASENQPGFFIGCFNFPAAPVKKVTTKQFFSLGVNVAYDYILALRHANEQFICICTYYT